MGFPSGSISFRRFAVIGKSPQRIDQAMLDKLAGHALRAGEIGVPDEIEYGWSGRHILDTNFSFENNVFADCLFFALRVDTNRVPGELKKAYLLMEQEALAAGNPSGFISKTQKHDCRDSVRRKIEDELRSGRHRRSRLFPVLWDVTEGVLYCNASGTGFEKLAELFARTFGLELEPLSAGTLGLRELESKGRRRDYEDFRPTRFVHGPAGESEYPEYPWVAKGPQPKDFVGNEFLLWLWHEADRRSGAIATESGEASIFIDRWLDLDCAYGQTGRDSLRGSGPARMPEARDALRSGKLPRKAGLMLDIHNQQFTLTLGAESLSVGTLRLPEVEDADTPRILFEERVALLRDLCHGIDALFERFLKVRASSAWEGQVNGMRSWIMEPLKKVAAA